MIYDREALRQYREEQQQAGGRQASGADLLAQIAADAPMDDATVTVWNGERWVAWDTWLATAPIIIEDAPITELKAAPAPASRPRGSNDQKALW